MKVLVRAFAKFRDIVGEKTCFDLKEGSTIGDLLETICTSHLGLKADLFNSNGTIGDGVTILINRKGLEVPDPQKTVLEEGDEVALLPPFSGG
ncbi:MAG TPA: MoaD family protein [Methanotrichaceae archaeon]|nr:MoaD family protein [Methanotrichaceae archaeon]